MEFCQKMSFSLKPYQVFSLPTYTVHNQADCGNNNIGYILTNKKVERVYQLLVHNYIALKHIKKFDFTMIPYILSKVCDSQLEVEKLLHGD